MEKTAVEILDDLRQMNQDLYEAQELAKSKNNQSMALVLGEIYLAINSVICDMHHFDIIEEA